MGKIVKLLCVGLLVAGQAFGATYWVSPTGLSGNTGADSSNAKSLAWFNANAAPGDICRMVNGTYSDAIDPRKSGTSGARIYYYGNQTAPTAVTVADIKFGGTNNSTAYGDYVTVKWVAASAFSGWAVYLQGGSNWKIANYDSVVKATVTGVSELGFGTSNSVLDSITATGTVSGGGQIHWMNAYSANATDTTLKTHSNLVKNSTFNVTVNNTGDTHIIGTLRAYNNVFFNNDWNITATSNGGWFFIIEHYRSHDNLYQNQDWTMTMASGTACRGIGNRDYSRRNRWLGGTYTISGAGTYSNEWTGAGSFSGSTSANTMWGTTWKSSSPNYAGYTGLFHGQNGYRSDTLAFNIIAVSNTSNIPFYSPGGTDYSGVILRHNTFYTAAQVAAYIGGSVAASPRMAANIFYGALANSDEIEILQVPSGVDIDSAGLFFAPGGAADYAIYQGGTHRTPGGTGALNSRWGSPKFTDSTYATLNATLVSGSYGLNAIWSGNYAGAIATVGSGTFALTAATLPNGNVGIPYSQHVNATGGTPPYGIFEWAGGTLPTGLQITDDPNEGSGAGLLYGTPTEAGTFEFTIGGTDAASATDTEDYSVTIEPQSLAFSFVRTTVISDITAGITFAILGDDDTTATVQALYGTLAADDTTVAAVRSAETNTWNLRLFGLTPATQYQVAITVTDGALVIDTTFTLTTKDSAWWEVPVKGPLVYVDPSKSDSNNGLTAASAKATIGAAWTALLALPNHGKGGGICLVPGTVYYGSANFEDTGNYATADSMYHIMSDGTATWSGSDPRLESGSLSITWTSLGSVAGGTGYFTTSYPEPDSVGLVSGIVSGRWRRWLLATSRGEYMNATSPLQSAIRRWWRNGDTLFVAPTNPATLSIRVHYYESMAWLLSPNIRVHGIKFTKAGGTNGIAIRVGTGGGSQYRASGTVIDSCQFRYTSDQPIYSVTSTSGLNDSVVVANNKFWDDMWTYPYSMIKNRTEESVTAIYTDGLGWHIRNNVIQSYFNGIYVQGSESDSTRGAFAEIYNDTLKYIRDDAIELDVGHKINVFVAKNTANYFNNGISLVPITNGPIWILYNMLLRPSDSGGAFKIGGLSFGRAFIYHNTCYTPVEAASSAVNNHGLGGVGNLHFRNNILVAGGNTYVPIENSNASDTLGNITNTFNFNNLFTWAGTTVVTWKAIDYDSTEVAPLLRFEANGVFSDPFFRDTTAWTDTLTAVSLTLGEAFQPTGLARNRAVRISGVNNRNQFITTTSPDMGAQEYQVVTQRRRGWLLRMLGIKL